MTGFDGVAAVFVAVPVAVLAYAYLAYPALLWLLTRRPKWSPPASDPAEWPLVSIVVPVYNEERAIGPTLEALLAVDYPADRRQILVVSDASSDRTHQVVRGFADRGVELLVLPERRGKTGAENHAALHARGDLMVNTDATTRILPDSLKPLVRVFQDPTVGVASGRDVSAGTGSGESNLAESGYVGYEMWVRNLETRFGGIVGASGCYMAVRRGLFNRLFPEALSRDFASPLIAMQAGFRAVSVPEAVCLVPRARALGVEYRRKVRTMARGLDTLWYLRAMLHPARYGRFAFMLASHKLARWVGFLLAPLVLLGLALLSASHGWAAWTFAAVLALLLTSGLAFRWPGHGEPPRLLVVTGFLVGAVAASLAAWSKAIRGERNPIWEPTRR